MVTTTNVAKKPPKMATLIIIGNSFPLKDENLTIVESKRTMIEKITMKTSEDFLVKLRVAFVVVLSQILRYRFFVVRKIVSTAYTFSDF